MSGLKNSDTVGFNNSTFIVGAHKSINNANNANNANNLNNPQNTKKIINMKISPMMTKQDISIQQQNNINVQKFQNAQQQAQQQSSQYNPFLIVQPKDVSVNYMVQAYRVLKIKWGMNDMINMPETSQNELQASISLISNFIDDPAKLNVDDIKKKYQTHQQELITLLKAVHETSSEQLGRAAGDLQLGIPKLMKICEQAYESLMCFLRIQEYANPNSETPNMKAMLKQELDLSKVNSKQKLILRLYKALSTEKLRKNLCEEKGGECWEEIKTLEGYPTQAYRKVCDIKSYIVQKCSRVLDPENWQILTAASSKSMLQDIEHTLTEVHDIDFPEVKLDRYKFSFANGIFVTKEQAHIEFNEKTGNTDIKYTSNFYPYESDKRENVLTGPDASTSSAKYFKEDFIEYDKDMDWYNIPTPKLQSVLDYQFHHRKDSEDISRILYALIGRMLYSRGDLENWEIISFIQGMGGTGKSTISKYVLKQFYNMGQIAEIDNKVEKQFGIGPLAAKRPYITIGDELDERCQLDLTQFLKMVSGETISAAVKGKNPIYLEWPSHLWFSGNQLPPWEDKGGALSRRIVTIFFKRMVRSEDKDMKLGEKIIKEMPNIMQKCVRAYLELVNEHAAEEFWKFCPEYFNETRKELQQISNIIRKFMESDEIIFDKSGMVLEKEFMERLFKYAEGNGVRISSGALRNKKFSINSIIQQINDVYDDADITYEKKTVTYKEKKWNKVMVLSGIRLKQEDDVNSELFNDETPKKMFAFENDFEVQNELNKLLQEKEEHDSANDGDDAHTPPPEEVIVEIEPQPVVSSGKNLNVDIEYARYDENGELLFNLPYEDEHGEMIDQNQHDNGEEFIEFP